MANKITVYHNSRCSKSRCALEFLQEKNLDFEVIEYLKDIPTKTQLKALIAQLGIKPQELIRTSEEEFKTHFKGQNLSDDEWIDAMLKFPKLIERPIVVKNGKAVIARPTERINELL
jgi:arsenate reductase